MIAGVLCQRKSIPSIYALDANFNVFPFVDDAGHFTVNNTSVTQSSGKAVFNGGTPQYLEFIGSETFNLQQNLDIDVQLTKNNPGSLVYTIFELKGATSYLVVQITTNIGNYHVFLTGATGGNTDNYELAGGYSFSFGQTRNLRVVYDAVAGTLKTYVDGVLDINQSGITPRVNESRVMYLSSITYYTLSADVDYFRVKVG
jgi:hypothetical protein